MRKACFGPSRFAADGAMKSVQIKNVPEGTHAVLRKRAAGVGMSLQEYLLAHLIAEAGD